MTLKPAILLIGAIMQILVAGAAYAQTGRTPPVFGTWTVDCGNTGICFASSFTRNQTVWVDIRIIRDWQADAPPLVRITTNNELADEGSLVLRIDGTQIDALPIAQLREIQSSVAVPSGFLPLGGEGYWYPAGPATKALLEAVTSGKSLQISLPATPDAVTVDVSLKGIRPALSWLDRRQNRNGTIAAIIKPGEQPAADAPHALPVVSPDQLPAEVAAIWSANRLCADIDPAIFGGLNAVRAPLPDDAFLYLLPCGAPSADNAAYVTILATGGGAARQVHVARMSERGPVALDLVYNARWIAADLQLTSYFKASVLGECGLWNRWEWNGSGFVLLEGAARNTCDAAEPDLSNWSSTWPPEKRSD